MHMFNKLGVEEMRNSEALKAAGPIGHSPWEGFHKPGVLEQGYKRWGKDIFTFLFSKGGGR